MEKLVNYIDSSASQEVCELLLCNMWFEFVSYSVQQCVNASQALCDMLRIAREISGPSPLLSALER